METSALAMLGYIAIYSGIGLRDEALEQRLGQALLRSPLPGFSTLRRDEHEEGPSCWLHEPGACWSTDPA